MLSVKDLFGNEEPFVDFQQLKRYRKVNGEKTISLTVLPSSKNVHAYHMIEEESAVHFEHDYIIKKLTEQSHGNRTVKRIDAVNHFYVEMINKQQPKIHDGSITFRRYMEEFVFEGMNIEVVVVDSFPAKSFQNLGNDNRLSLLQKGLERFKAEFELVGNQARFKYQVGRDTDFQFRYSHNIKALSKNIDTTNLSTRISGTGAEGIYATYTSPNADIFGIIDSPPINDERFTTEESLLEEMQSRIEDSPEFSFTIDFVDLRAAGYPYTVPNEGDRVFVIYEPMNDLILETRIVEIVETFDANLKPIKTEVTLANHKKTFAGTMFNNVQKQLSNIVNDDGVIKYSVLDEAVRIATEALHSAQTELEFNNGIIAREKTDPNKMVLFNSAGLGISDDGGQTFKTAITGDGIVADVITAGTIRGIDIIGTNIISYSNDNNDVITMNDGEIETFVSGVKRFGIYGQGLKAFSWITGEEVASFRSTNLNGSHGAGIMGSGSYFNIGEVDQTDGSDETYMFFDFEEKSISSWVDEFYVDGRITANGFIYTDAIDALPYGSGNHVYIRPWDTGEVRITEFETVGSDGQYRDLRARSFPTSTSLRENKSEVEVYKEDALSVIKNLNTYLYKIKGEEEQNFKQLGLMVDETPKILHGRLGDSMELYALATFAIKGIQQLLDRVEKLEGTD